MKNILKRISILAIIFTCLIGLGNGVKSIVTAQSLGSGGGTITQLDQFTSTSSPVSAITQRTKNKPILITGLNTGECLTLAANGLATTTGAACGSGGGSSFSTNPFTANYFVSTSTTATSTFAGPLSVNGNLLQYKTYITVGTSSADYVVVGTADDEINAAITYVNSTGGGTVFIKSGTYTTAAQILMKSNVSLVGAGIGNTIIQSSNSLDYTLIGTTQSGTTKTIYNNITVKNITFKSQLGQIMEINNTNYVDVRNNEIYFSVTTPIRESLRVEYSQNVNVGDNYLHDLTGNGIQINAVDYFTVANNLLNGVVAHDTDCIDIDTDFLRTKAIVSQFGNVVGNALHNCVNGIRLENGNNFSVLGNIIASSTDTGIYLNTSDSLPLNHVVVSGNTISSSTSNGIAMVDSVGGLMTNILVNANTITNSGYSGGSNIRAGIQINAASTTVSNNTIYNSGGPDANGGGIVIYKRSGSRILNNKIASSTRGINFWDGSCVEAYTASEVAGNSFDQVTTNYGNDCGVLSQTGININGTIFSPSGVGTYGISTSTPGSTLTVGGDINFIGALKTNGNAGSLGQLLQSTATGAQWIATSSLGITSGSGTVNSGLIGQPAFYASNGTAVSGTSSLFFANSNIGIGTTTPTNGKLSVIGNVYTSDGAALGKSLIGSLSTYPGIWFGTNADSPAFGGYSFLYDSIVGTIFNTPTGLGMKFRVNNNDKMSLSTNGGFSIGNTYSGTDAGTNNLIVEGRVGIASSTPGSTLTVKPTAGVNPFTISSPTDVIMAQLLANGNFGIGSSTPSQAFHVSNGSVLIQPDSNWTTNDTANLFLGDTGVVLKTTFAGTTFLQSANPIDIRTSGAVGVSLSTNNTTALTALSGGNVGVGSTTPAANFQATNQSANATTTIEFGKKAQTKGTCIKMYDAGGTAWYYTPVVGTGALTASATACASVTGF